MLNDDLSYLVFSPLSLFSLIFWSSKARPHNRMMPTSVPPVTTHALSVDSTLCRPLRSFSAYLYAKAVHYLLQIGAESFDAVERNDRLSSSSIRDWPYNSHFRRNRTQVETTLENWSLFEWYELFLANYDQATQKHLKFILNWSIIIKKL